MVFIANAIRCAWLYTRQPARPAAWQTWPRLWRVLNGNGVLLGQRVLYYPSLLQSAQCRPHLLLASTGAFSAREGHLDTCLPAARRVPDSDALRV